MAIPIFQSFFPTVAKWVSSAWRSEYRVITDNNTGAPIGLVSPNANGPEGIWAPTPLSAEQIESPTAAMLADLNAVYQLNVAPYTRYESTGTALVPLGAGAIDGTTLPYGLQTIPAGTPRLVLGSLSTDIVQSPFTVQNAAGVLIEGHLVVVSGTALAGITVGTTPVTSGTASGLLWNNAGVLASGPTTVTALGNITLGGADVASPGDRTLGMYGVLAGTSDAAGGSLTVQGGASTGSAAGGGVILRATPAGSSGSTQNAFVNRARFLANRIEFGANATDAVTVAIGNTSASGYALRISSNITGSTTSRGERIDGAVQSGVTTLASYYESNAATADASFTLTSLRHFGATQGTIGASSTVTSQFGFFADSTLTGAGSNYGFYGNIASSAGRFNFYANGTAANFFNGDLTIQGSTGIPVGGTAGVGYKFSSTSNFGIFFGSNAPTLVAAKGSLYLRSDATTNTTRAYIATDSAGTWTAINTVG